ncbi:hypothetical protein FRX31_010902, partial [Thalictrum thalictroides]
HLNCATSLHWLHGTASLVHVDVNKPTNIPDILLARTLNLGHGWATLQFHGPWLPYSTSTDYCCRASLIIDQCTSSSTVLGNRNFH